VVFRLRPSRPNRGLSLKNPCNYSDPGGQPGVTLEQLA
jgi:hypothetical protein